VLMLCVATFRGHGTLTIRGVMLWKGGGNYDVPVVGGSGVFKGARGTLHVRTSNYWASVGERSSNEYVLRLPGTFGH
jgi:hypothetical protein